MATLGIVEITKEKNERLCEIYNKVSDVLNSEIRELSSESAERIVFCHIIIETMHNKDVEALQRMGILIEDSNLEIVKEE